MKITNNASTTRTLTIIVLSVTMVLGSVPFAFANTPNVSPIPQNVFLDGTNILKITADSSTLKQDRATISMYDPAVTAIGSNTLTPNNVGGICRAGAAVGGTQWELRDSNNLADPIVYTFTNSGDSFKVTFGTDGIVNIFDITGAATVTSATAKWVDVSGGNDPAKYDILTDPDDPFDSYLVRSCGREGVSTFGQGGNLYSAEATVFVVQAVGGSIIPINASSLVLAGMFTNAFWILPIVGAASAAGFGILRLRK